MEFLNQSWFWALLFTAIAPLLRDWMVARSQVKLERQKRYESDLFKAHNKLYQFISYAYGALWPPSEPQRDYRDLMKHSYFKDVKPNILFFNSEIRDILSKLESHYNCLSDPDLIPEKPFDEFYNKVLPKLLRRLEKTVEKKTDLIIHKGG